MIGAAVRRDEIGQRHIGTALAPGKLLAQRVEDSPRLAARLIGIDHNVVALRVRRPEAHHGAGAEPALLDDAAEHRAGVLVEARRGGADLGVVEDRGKFSGQLPGGEERRPIDELDQFGDGIVGQHLGP